MRWLRQIPFQFTVLFAFAVGLMEVVDGTPPTFALGIVICFLCIGAIYNLLGGLHSVSGITFTIFCMRTLLISQVAKVVLAEDATSKLLSPMLTIQVYVVFFVCLLMAAFLLSRLRVPIESPLTATNFDPPGYVYYLLLISGCSMTVFTRFALKAEDYQVHGGFAGFALGLCLPFVILSMLIALQQRIVLSHGQHSLNLKVIVPMCFLVVLGLFDATRNTVVAPFAVYAIALLLFGRRPRLKHFAACGIGAVLYFFFVTPFCLILRGIAKHDDFTNRINTAIDLASNLSDVNYLEALTSGPIIRSPSEEYYNDPDLFTLSRLSMIRVDSNLVHLSEHGYHYGWLEIGAKFKWALPTFLVGDKGLSGDNLLGAEEGALNRLDYTTDIAFDVVGDSFGAFGWVGVILVPFIWWLPFYWLTDSFFHDFRSIWVAALIGILILEAVEFGLGWIFPGLRYLILFFLLASIVRYLSSVAASQRPRTVLSNDVHESDESFANA